MALCTTRRRCALRLGAGRRTATRRPAPRLACTPPLFLLRCPTATLHAHHSVSVCAAPRGGGALSAAGVEDAAARDGARGRAARRTTRGAGAADPATGPDRGVACVLRASREIVRAFHAGKWPPLVASGTQAILLADPPRRVAQAASALCHLRRLLVAGRAAVGSVAPPRHHNPAPEQGEPHTRTVARR